MFAKTNAMKVLLVTTDHFLVRLWFKDDEDFRVAMNYAAIASLITSVNILAFILMSNHVHFVLYCTAGDAKLFIDTFKKLYGAYYCRKYNVHDYLRRVGVDIREASGDAATERVIAYVQMNCVAANICASPFFYPWGTGGCFFNENPPAGYPVSALSRRAQIRLTKSNVRLPTTWQYCDAGYILPESFVNKKGVESLFGTPKRYGFFLNTSSKASRILEKNASPSFRDQIILAASQDLCRSLFRVDGPDSLSKEQKAELLKQLRRRFGADVNQLCRVTGLPYKEAAEMLEF